MSSSQSTQTSGPSSQALPYITGASSALQGAYNANQGTGEAIGNGLDNAFNSYNALQKNNPTTNAASGYITSTLGQPYSANPQLGNIVNTSNNDVMNSVNSLFDQAGQVGSSAQQGDIARQLANNTSNLMYGDYSNWQQRQQAAAGMSPSLISAQNQGALGSATLGTAAATEPYIGSQIYASGLGSLWGNSQTVSTTQSPSLLSSLGGIVGQGLSGWASGGFKT